ncbi:MAG: 16S rRNA (guanine(527)-N(7))-methyltransferase RsmG [Metamycoplasmataceae bacterium]
MKLSKQKIKDYCLSKNYDFSILEKYVEILLEKNKFINLIGFDEETLWTEGIYSSILCMEEIDKQHNFVKKELTFLDIGAGSGLPSIPFMLLHTNMKLVILEPLKKRFDFLIELKTIFNLTNLEIKCDRVENVFNTNYQFDLITARAVSELKNLIMASFHLLKKNGWFVFLKGKNFQNEIDIVDKKIPFLKNKLIVNEIENPLNEIEIHKNYLVSLKKEQETPNNWPLLWTKIIKF